MTMDRAQEAAIIKRAVAGDPAAVRSIVTAHTGRIYALAYRLLASQEDAEDVVQDTFVRAWTSLSNWRGDARLSTWLHRVALNLCRDRQRKHRETVMAEPPDMTDPAPLPDAALSQQQTAARVQTALAALPDRQREALTLCALEGYSNREAADILDVSVDALESLLSRGRRGLKAQLTNSQEPPLI
ncbi:MAG: RNA polymerase sigma factor [Pseudomonadota bacterium]